MIEPQATFDDIDETAVAKFLVMAQEKGRLLSGYLRIFMVTSRLTDWKKVLSRELESLQKQDILKDTYSVTYLDGLLANNNIINALE